MDNNLVIKVKYGDIIRRFGVFVNSDGSLDMGMAGLEAKIRKIFKFTSDDDISFTYKDEDQDMITLVDDDDLRDAIKQRLNPLRINVEMKTNGSRNFDTRSSGLSAPKSSHQGQVNALSLFNSGVAEVLKSLPEPLGEVLSKISSDFASKAVSSSPVLVELLQQFVKLGVPVSESSGNDSDISVNEKATDGPKASKMSESEVILHDKLVGTNNTNLCVSSAMGEVIDVSKPATTTNTCVDLPEGSDKLTQSTRPPICSSSFYSPISDGMPQKGGQVQLNGKPNLFGPSASDTPVSLVYAPPTPSQDCYIRRKQPKGSAQSFKFGSHSKRSTPISGIARANLSDYTTPPPWSNMSYSHYNNMREIFHEGIGCDGCDVRPITGPRFKSKVKEDYDLCSFCFSRIGNEAEYTKIDLTCRKSSPSSAHSFVPRLDFHKHTAPLRGENSMLGIRTKSLPRKISCDSCFVHDVNIPDGYIITPDTVFTKIWRMRNNGVSQWPNGIQLVWIGGDLFTASGSASVKIEEANGCPVGHELDVAVNFVSPSYPGRYISHWCMQSPCGRKFGERVWVIIQVDTPLNDIITTESIDSLNLNIPPKGSDQLESNQIIDLNAGPVTADKPDFVQSDKSAESAKSMVDEVMKNGELESSICKGKTLASYPSMGSSEVQQPTLFGHGLSVDGESIDRNFIMVDSLLKDLEIMGFKQRDLNEETLRSNNYNLEQSVDDLCGVSEWDPILEELQEMGFNDNETNKKLLMKNSGSIKRVVMDLVAEEKTTK